MLHISIIAVGKLKESFWKEACQEYLKRLKGFASVTVKEVADANPANCGGDSGAIDLESKSVLDVLPQDSQVILLDIKGKPIASEGLAQMLENYALEGRNDICFVIGGSCGVNESVRKSADARISLGRITLPHNLARVVLLEQIYRAFKINANQPYHK